MFRSWQKTTGFGSGLRQPKGRSAAISAIALALPAAVILASAARTQAQEKQAAPQSIRSIEERTGAFIDLLEARRKEQGIVGAAVVVAQGDRIVRAIGLGLRSIESNEPVTEDTLFAVGSVTKQFTAMGVALTVSEGKMAFEDHPRRYVPSFRLQDAEADAKLTMIDLLAHRSGLDRSDVTWILAPFTQQELFELASRARPIAKLREKFLYNNMMYALAGAAVAQAQQTGYERFMTDRFLKPLGMSSSTFALEEFTASMNRAIGYAHPSAGPSKVLKPIDLACIAPGGALNSTARDMGAWLRFLNSHGRSTEAVKIAPADYARLFERQQLVASNLYYGLGFFLHTKSGVLVAEHGGNVDGYTAQVVHVPDRALSVAVLTNQNHSQLGAIAQELFWEVVVKPEIVGTPPPAASPPKSGGEIAAPARPIAPKDLAGQYFSSQGGGTFEVTNADGALTAVISGQPPYPLKPTETNSFELSGLSGFSLEFAESHPMPGRITAFLRQPPSHPAGNLHFMKKDDAWLARAREEHSGPGKDLIASYSSDDQIFIMEIVPYQRGIALVIAGQTPFLLKDLGSDLYHLEGAPETYQLQIKRSSNGRVTGFTLIQPQGRLEMRAAPTTSIGGAEEARKILDNAVTAAGGAEAVDRISSLSAAGRVSAPTHALDGRYEDHLTVGKRASLCELGAFGKYVFKLRTLTTHNRSLTVIGDGKQVLEDAGKALLASQFFAVPHMLRRWRERFQTVMAAGEASVNGENAFVIELSAAELAPTRLYVSTKSFLILREETPIYANNALQSESARLDYSDYRNVNGVLLPFSVSFPVPILGRVTATFDSIVLNQPIDPKVFEIPPL